MELNSRAMAIRRRKTQITNPSRYHSISPGRQGIYNSDYKRGQISELAPPNNKPQPKMEGSSPRDVNTTSQPHQQIPE
jgi:hypothetical protein